MRLPAESSRLAFVAGHLNLVTVPDPNTTGTTNSLPMQGTGEVLARIPYRCAVG
ncbi:hypothetical protein [Kutzneria kofuensis]|uniref:Uncharacterized protein n=1 Tax=Kutzneria kofuensis TaxID=103725 RepID=A0A7W9KC51_9PSEU|nr:hypothetical protein [Kutzneria kofuensis]MBB5889812.1 hypothetical protein [Kutzneria kofuensis]